MRTLVQPQIFCWGYVVNGLSRIPLTRMLESPIRILLVKETKKCTNVRYVCEDRGGGVEINSETWS
jgi:hypothetical protein